MAYIKAISYYLPEMIVTNEDLLKEFPEWSVDKVAEKVGVKSRHVAAMNETATDMAEKAARKLFEESGVDPLEIDFVLLCTQSPDYHFPSSACILQDRLGIPTTAGANIYIRQIRVIAQFLVMAQLHASFQLKDLLKYVSFHLELMVVVQIILL